MLQIASRSVQWAESSASEPTGERHTKMRRLERRRDPLIKKEPILSPPNSSPTFPSSIPTVDSCPSEIQASNDLCARFCARNPNFGPEYYLVDDTYKHKFELCPNSPFLKVNKSAYETLSDILAQPSNQVATVVDQLNIALTLVRATLQFWSTPWWRTYWSLRDIGVIREPKVPILSETVRSIHVNVDLHDVESAKRIPEPVVVPGGLT